MEILGMLVHVSQWNGLSCLSEIMAHQSRAARRLHTVKLKSRMGGPLYLVSFAKLFLMSFVMIILPKVMRMKMLFPSIPRMAEVTLSTVALKVSVLSICAPRRLAVATRC
eukprot:TRINITY_DN5656_c0_g1_i1.p3 TRINITY_DN5656_c0_g1~~TRINITY_DN5656_c0_g1_i1.p3  ORF type:complete len:110 (-),score=15.97 TRINITY_DN5656_c0_g1_i1:715-1044(-)